MSPNIAPSYKQESSSNNNTSSSGSNSTGKHVITSGDQLHAANTTPTITSEQKQSKSMTCQRQQSATRTSISSSSSSDAQHQAASSLADKTAQEVGVNFMSKFRDKDTRVLKNLNSTQFIEVWNNYDKDGKLRYMKDVLVSSLL